MVYFSVATERNNFGTGNQGLPVLFNL